MTDARASALAFSFWRVERGILVEMKEFFVEDAARFENAYGYFVLCAVVDAGAGEEAGVGSILL